MHRAPMATLLLLLSTPAWANPPPCQPPFAGQGLAAAALPYIPYNVDEEEFVGGFPGLDQFPVHPQIMLVELKKTTTVTQANTLLCSQGATVRGVRPGHPEVSGGVLAIQVPATSRADLAQRLAAVRQSPHVQRATVDTLLSTTQLPFRDTPGSVHPAWQTWPLAGGSGNWGMIAIRAPQLWNLAEAMFKDDLRSTVGIVDSGFGEVDDITYMTRLDNEEGAHGTHVSGIIAATWGNNSHVDGVHPTADLVVTPLVGSIDGTCPDVYCNRESGGELMITNLENLLQADDTIRVVNLSLAFNWYSYGIDADTDTDAQDVANVTGDLFIATVNSGVARGDYDMPLFVACAGNDRGATATNASPFNSAALRDGFAPVIVVEALETTTTPTDPDYPYTLAWFSNSGAHLAAPGTDILSLSTESFTLLGVTYYLEYMSGTSMAAPHVTGIIGALHALAPDLPRPTATTNAVLDLLQTWVAPVDGGAAGLPLAFEAAMDLDAISADTTQLARLLDIDDGTQDGNQRIGYLPSIPWVSYTVTDLDADADGGMGDGVITMSDFRRWRDWLYQVEGVGNLDGASSHAKKDPNNNRRRDTVFPSEGSMPRGDFNGDGVMSRTATRYVPGAISDDATDLDVLQALFSDAFYDATDLDALQDSGDITVWPQPCMTSGYPTLHHFTSSVERVSDSTSVGSRNHQFIPMHLYTVAASSDTVPEEYEVTVRGVTAFGVPVWTEVMTVEVTRGEDVFLAPTPCPIW